MKADIAVPRHTVIDLPLIGGTSCLDFSNTAAAWDHPSFHGYLDSYGDLLIWAGRAGLIDETTERLLRQAAEAAPAAAEAALRKGLALRATIQAIFAAVAGRRPAPQPEVMALDQMLVHALPHRGIAVGAERFHWAWRDSASLDRPLWPIVLDAARVLMDADPSRIKQCGGAECGWLFVDTSKNGSRRWCQMEACGSRSKAHSYYHRKTGKRQSAP
ncbi:MAG TPA: CGNR zinc finger domain-containing protein [Stellaceae bacterium]|nr:CGNR zinc finger domain-containing protein [Stellaceae bacterium]